MPTQRLAGLRFATATPHALVVCQREFLALVGAKSLRRVGASKLTFVGARVSWRSSVRAPTWLRHALAAIEDGNRAHGLGSAIFERLELALVAGAVAGF